LRSSRDNILFHGKDLGNLIRGYEPTIRNEVEQWDRNKVLAGSEPDLIAYLVDKYTLDPPRLIAGDVYIEGEGETKINVSGRWEYGFGDERGARLVNGSFITVAIPFEGDPDLFHYQASTFSFSHPRGEVEASKVLITFSDVKLDPQQVRREIDAVVARISECLGWIRNDCDAWNARVRPFVTQCIQDRKKRLLEQASTVSALGLPIKRRPDSAAGISIPVIRKKPPIALPPTPKGAFKPEPLLPDSEYDYILTVIDRLSQSIERSPSTFTHMSEEQIRDLILVSLNGHYEGGATGETFNASGKTDIIIRSDSKNVFIAECKFWHGPKGFLETIEQILGYLTWRDTKAAVLIFSKNADFTNVLSGVADAVPKHPCFKRELRRISETHTRYLFKQKEDPARDLYLAVQVFNIPKGSAS
jgi:hypothetical protein